VSDHEGVRRRAAPALRALVDGYSGYRLGGPPGVHRGLPSPWLTLIVTLDDPLLVGWPGRDVVSYDALVGGLHTRPAQVVHPGRQSGVQVALSPLGARTLLGLPAGALAETDLPLRDLLGGPCVDALRERLLAAPTWPARFAVLDEALLRLAADGGRGSRGRPPPEVERAWRVLAGRGGAVGVRDLAADVGWSERRLLTRFRAEVGLAPKQAARVVRFDAARRELFARAAAGRPVALADLAADHGYFDQAHLAREFRELAHAAPTLLLAEERRFVQAEPSDG
jgi:AraC-like DNA-binding protein